MRTAIPPGAVNHGLAVRGEPGIPDCAATEGEPLISRRRCFPESFAGEDSSYYSHYDQRETKAGVHWPRLWPNHWQWSRTGWRWRDYRPLLICAGGSCERFNREAKVARRLKPSPRIFLQTPSHEARDLRWR